MEEKVQGRIDEAVKAKEAQHELILAHKEEELRRKLAEAAADKEDAVAEHGAEWTSYMKQVEAANQ